MSDIILQQFFVKQLYGLDKKNSWEHLSYHWILVSVANDQLVKSEILRGKEKNWKPLAFTHRHSRTCSMWWRQFLQKTLFVRMWFSDFDHQNLTIALSFVSSFTNGSIFFMENENPIYLVIFLFSYSQFERLCEVKEKKIVITTSAD